MLNIFNKKCIYFSQKYWVSITLTSRSDPDLIEMLNNCKTTPEKYSA